MVAILNGRLPVTMLHQAVNGAAGQVLEAQTSIQWGAMCAAASADGIYLAPEPDDGVPSCYRSYDAQVYAKQKQAQGGPTAATPGQSNHGLGVAIDINITSSVMAWLNAHAEAFGFDNVQGQATVPAENWHWVRTRIVANLTNLVEATMTPDEHNALMQILSNSNAVFNAVFNGGGSMKDGHKSISQSLAEINSTVGLQVTRDDNGDGKLEYISQRQDNADTGTKVRDIEKKLDTVIAQTKK